MNPVQTNNQPDLGLNVTTLTVFKLSRMSLWSLEPMREEKHPLKKCKSLTSEGKTHCLFAAYGQKKKKN